MKLETFFEKFEQFAEAQNAVAKMRELVLQLAVTGRLVEQIDEEESAAELLEIARGERADLVAARKIKARTIAPVEADEQPFAIPARWQWARLSDVGFELGQKVPDGRFTYIDVGSIDSDKGRISERVETLEPAEAPSRARKLVAKGTVIYSTVRPYLLNIAIIEHVFEHEPIASTAFGILHPFSGINNRYLFYWLRSAPFTAYVQDGMKGMAYPAINDEKFYSGYIPVPPSAEQKRIVAKVDELMALCDRLDAQQQERATRHAELARAALARFAEAPTPVNLGFLFHPSYVITPADLRKSILTLAVQGKLVRQDPDDESAQHSFPGLKSLVADSSDNSDVPSRWELCSYRSLTSLVTSGSRGWKEFYSDTGAIFVRTQNIKTDRLILDDVAYVNLPQSAEGKRAQVLKDDILITITGANVTKAARVEKQIPEAYVSQHIALTRPIWSEMSEWLHLCFISHGSARGMLEQLAYGDKPGLNLNNIRDLVLPIPPLAEQRRIVAKVDQLMSLVDRLEVQLGESKVKSAALLEAVVHELLNPSAEVIDLASYRAAVGCYTINKMSKQPYFGRTAAMKILYLAENHVGLDLGFQPEREAAGPLDSWIYRFEDEAKGKGWFKAVEKNNNGKKKVEYQPGKMLAAQAEQAESQLSEGQRNEFDRMLGLVSGKTTEEVEIIATLFAAWNDFLIDGHVPSDDEIVTEVRENWHVKKERFAPATLRQWLDWLRRHDLVPKGRMPRTAHQSKLPLN